MAQDSRFTNYKPAALALTGLATACGLYYIYHVHSQSRAYATSLRRSNAIHRSHGRPSIRQASRVTVEWTDGNPGAPLGELVIRSLDQSKSYVIAPGNSPSMEDITHDFGPIPPPIVEEITINMIMSILFNCLGAVGNPPRIAELAEHSMQDLVNLILEGDEDGIRHSGASVISQRFSRIPIHLIHRGMDEFLMSDPWRAYQAGWQMSVDGPAETEEGDQDEADMSQPGHHIKGLVYHIAESEATRKAFEHRGFHCEECGERPIRGVRWHCLNCPDFDLCSVCELRSKHPKTHVFAKVTIPLPILSQPTKELDLWYPGDPKRIHPPLNPAVSRHLQTTYKYEEPQLDALYDQFGTLANVAFPSDPCGMNAAMDIRAFRKALTSERWQHRFRPNALYDRMFAFYDTNRDGLIGFEEFLDGMAYLRGPDRFKSLERALQGYDFDDDGYVDRKDFMRLLEAKHEVLELLIYEMVESHQREQTLLAMSTIRSRQPTSSVFNVDDVPAGEPGRRSGKVADKFNDMQPLPATQSVLEDDGNWSRGLDQLRRRHRTNNSHEIDVQERLRYHLSRFESQLRSFDEQQPPQDFNPEALTSRVEFDRDADVEMDDSVNVDGQNISPADLREQATDEQTEESDILNQEILWELLKQGYQELLNPLFEAREQLEMQIVATQAERQRWRSEINLEKWRSFGRYLHESASANHVIDVEAETRKTNDDHVSGIRAEIVPTDFETLARLEDSIASKSLDDLLSSSGFSRINEDPANAISAPPESSERSNSSSERLSLDQNLNEPGSSMTATVEDGDDPSLRQTNASQSNSGEQNDSSPRGSHSTFVPRPPSDEEDYSRASEEKPSHARVQQLAQLDAAALAWDERGGNGRLSLGEIEEMMQQEDKGDLRWLAVGWLEWASF